MTEIDDRAKVAVARYGADIRAFCARRLPPDLAADAVSEVMAVTWRRRQVLPDEPKTLPWMYGVARKVVEGQRRAQRRWTARQARVAATEIRDQEPGDAALLRTEENRQVLLALGRLGRADQEILRLAAWEGLGNRQIAAVLGITPAAADQRLSRSKRRLATEFDRITSGGTR